MTFSRKQIIEPKIITFNTVIDDMAKMITRLIGEDIRIEKHLDPDLSLIEADPGQLEQIFVNLLVNARDAINENTAGFIDNGFGDAVHEW